MEKRKSNELKVCVDGQLLCVSARKGRSPSDQEKTEPCTEHAQRSQLWHLRGEQSSHCAAVTQHSGTELRLKAAASLCGHKYKQWATTKTRGSRASSLL